MYLFQVTVANGLKRLARVIIMFCIDLARILRQVDINVAHVLMSFLCGVLTDKLDLTLITRQPHVNNYSSELFDNN